MVFTWQELIDRARTYVDDDHSDTEGFISPERWLQMANVEYAQLRKRWVRNCLITPAHVDTTFGANGTVEVQGVLCTIGVAQNLGNGAYRVVPAAQSRYGSNSFWNTSTGWAEYWEAHGEADDLTYQLEPRDTANSYFVRTIPTVPYQTAYRETIIVPDGPDYDQDTRIDLPYGGDEALVLGLAKRAGIKDGTMSRVAEDLLRQANEDLAFQAAGRIKFDSPRARSTPRTSSGGMSFSTDPRLWRY